MTYKKISIQLKMIWNLYSNPTSRYLNPKENADFFEDHVQPDIEAPVEPIVKASNVGVTVTEGSRFGNFIQSTQGYIRAGVSRIELQTQQGGGAEPVGAESYGKEARRTLREISKATGVEFTSVHIPTNVGNLSGLGQQGFSDDQRKRDLDEVKKAIDFAADVAQGGAVVIHTGEYQRAISEQKWAKDEHGNYQFLGYDEEPGRAITYMVDERTGQVLTDIRKSQIIREPVYRTDEKGNYVDYEGNILDPSDPEDLFERVPEWDEEKKRFITREVTWKEIEERTREYNRKHKEKITEAEMAFRINMSTNLLRNRGMSIYYAREYERLKEAREKLEKQYKFYEEAESRMSPEELKQVMMEDESLRHYGVHGESMTPSELIKKRLAQIKMEMKHIHESSASADAEADKINDTLKYVKPIDVYAKEQSLKSYAEAGIYAWQQTQNNPYVKKDIFLAPENIFPEMGYGSHPDELIDLVKNAREKMVEYLTSPEIEDPHRILNKENGKIVFQKVKNPYYRPDMTPEKARKIAERHIKATLDTQHLGMWRKHFVPKPGETKQQTDKRFNKWYMQQIKKMEKEGIIGNIHLVDSLGGGHHHLAIGEGDLPLTDALSYLKKKGYFNKGGILSSEAHGEETFGTHRMLTKTWSALGSPIYSRFVPGMRGGQWGEIQGGYFGYTAPPMSIVGAYAPSEDWKFWSQTPIE